MKKPVQTMTLNEISEMITFNEKLKEEIGNVLDKNVIGLLRSAKQQLVFIG